MYVSFPVDWLWNGSRFVQISSEWMMVSISTPTTLGINSVVQIQLVHNIIQLHMYMYLGYFISVIHCTVMVTVYASVS